MIHAACAEHGVVDANGNAGAQQCVHNNRRPSRRNFTDV
jgi:hypothetical protein